MFLSYCRSHEIKLEAGQSYQLKIVPTQHIATDAFKQLSLDNRGCRLSKEIYDGSIFKNYSEKGCIFECVLQKAVSDPKYMKKLIIRTLYKANKLHTLGLPSHQWIRQSCNVRIL